LWQPTRRPPPKRPPQETWISITTRAVPASLLLILLGCGSRQPEPIYRYVKLMDGSTVRLGEPFDREDLATPLNDTTYRFNPGSFAGGGTIAITAYTDTAGLLRTLEFSYDGSESFETKVRDYTRNLGPPNDSSAAPADGVIVVWEDSLTRFELHAASGAQSRL
jgi:hypothetical protein